MGMTLPPPPMEQAKVLMESKVSIEEELSTNISILRSHNVDMQSPLVDAEGFPRADIDIWAVRTARVRIIELRNDLKNVTDKLGKVLESVYDPSLQAPQPSNQSANTPVRPFAKVDAVAPGSPASEADMKKGDLIVKFGRLDQNSFQGSLQPLAEIVAENENRPITIRVLRSEQPFFLTLTPRKDWGGRGMLGCHIIPYTP